MSEPFLNGKVTLHGGDCREVLREFPDNHFDSVVTDPPYALVSIVKRFGSDGAAPAKSGKSGVYTRASAGFMGKRWDNGEAAFAVEFWAEVMRVLKPGGHVAAFSGTRTYHRLACAIEDSGFEIRDCIFWCYGSGFPKSHNIGKNLDAKSARCNCSESLRNVRADVDPGQSLSSGQEQDLRSDVLSGADLEKPRGTTFSIQSEADDSLRGVRQEANSAAGMATEGENSDLLAALQWGSARQGMGKARAQSGGGNHAGGKSPPNSEPVRSDESCLEGRSDLSEATRELREREIRPLPAGIDLDGSGGRVRHGASSRHGQVDRPGTDPDGMRASQGSHATQQPEIELGVVAGQPEPQASGTWDNCERCGKPIVPDGLGTALKPALEPVCIARKPLSEPTVAANVLRWGTGAINVDGCRIGTDGGSRDGGSANPSNGVLGDGLNGWKVERVAGLGRWPANLAHDGSDEVVESFPETHSAGAARAEPGGGTFDGSTGIGFGAIGVGRKGFRIGDDAGSAARFFFSAKADADDRIGSKHPTVKPVDLMQWLVRLITPKGGTILDPFAGTGTSGEAAWREGFSAVLVEREPEYQADIARRMKHALSGPDERRHVILKAKGRVEQAGPLFAGEKA